MNQKNTCCICSQIAGISENDLISKLLGEEEYLRRVILESKHFAVIPSLGPIAPGHVLLCPKEHYRSFAALPHTFQKEFRSVTEEITELLERTYHQHVHFFEHGMASGSYRTVCTVEHAHLHIVPTAADVIENVTEHPNWQVIEGDVAGSDMITGGAEYLYYRSPAGIGRIALAVADGFDSQYLRRIFAAALGKADSWNWRREPAPHATHTIYLTLTSPKSFRQ